MASAATSAARQETEVDLRRRLSIEPDNAAAWNTAGAFAYASGQKGTAAAGFARALSLQPTEARFRANLGEALRAAGRVEEAVAVLATAIAAGETDPEVLSNLGVALGDQGSPARAAAAFGAATAVAPSRADLHFNLAACGGAEHSIERGAYARALTIDPHHVDALFNLGQAYFRDDNLGGARALCRRALALRPIDARSLRSLSYFQQCLGRPAEAVILLERARAAGDTGREWVAARCFAETYRPGTSAQAQRAVARHAAPAFGPHGRPARRPETPIAAPIRVGLLSPDFGRHPVARFCTPLMAHADRRRIDLVCYSDRRMDDDETRRMRGMVPAWRDVCRLDDDALAALIVSDRIDVLVEMAGHTAGSRLGVVARRPAPLQMSWIGFPSTIGLPQIDCIITDGEMVPPALEAGFGERLLRLPTIGWCYEPPADGPAILSGPDTGPGLRFGCFCNPAKINDNVLGLWSRLLAALPESHLHLMYVGLDVPFNQADILGRVVAAGIQPDRVTCRGAEPYPDYLKRYGAIDIALDPFPFSGGATTADALWMGVPVVTLAGGAMAGRISAAILRAIGAGDLVADSEEGYLATARVLALDPERRHGYRTSLRKRMLASPLCDGAAFADAFAAALIRAVRDQKARS